MSLSENLDDVFELIKKKDQSISLQAFDLFCMFPHELINDFLRRDDFANAKILVEIISTIRMVNEGFLETIIILASNEPCAQLAAEDEKVMRRLFSLAKKGEPLKFILPLTQVGFNILLSGLSNNMIVIFRYREWLLRQHTKHCSNFSRIISRF